MGESSAKVPDVLSATLQMERFYLAGGTGMSLTGSCRDSQGSVKVLFRGRPRMGRVQRPIFRDSVRECPQRMYTAVRWQFAVNSGFSRPLGFAGFHNALVSMCRESHQWLMHRRAYGRIDRRWPGNRKTAAAGAQVLRFENGRYRQVMPCCVDARGI